MPQKCTRGSLQFVFKSLVTDVDDQLLRSQAKLGQSLSLNTEPHMHGIKLCELRQNITRGIDAKKLPEHNQSWGMFWTARKQSRYSAFSIETPESFASYYDKTSPGTKDYSRLALTRLKNKS